MAEILLENAADAIPLALVTASALRDWRGTLTSSEQAWLERSTFAGQPGESCWLPDQNGAPARVVAGCSEAPGLATLGALPRSLPEGVYRLEAPADDLTLLGWPLGAYQYSTYRKPTRAAAQLLVPDAAQRERARRTAAAVCLVRDLINAPANEMGPEGLAAAAEAVAARHDASCTTLVGDELLARRFNTIHAVGRASNQAPRLVDFSWGDPNHPKVTLVGKGVTFDSGGLDLKPAEFMRLMKKDMGGAATVLGLADLLMSNKLPIRLRVLVTDRRERGGR